MADWVTTFWLPDQPPRKSNSRQVVRNRRTGKPMVIKSAEARAWVKCSLSAIPEEARLGLGSADRPLKMLFECFYESKRPDLSVELVLDVLERAGVISNDRHVYEYTAKKLFSRDMPGVLVHVGYLEDKNETD